MESSEAIRDLISQVRRRWRLLRLYHGTLRGACAASGVLATALVAAHFADRSALALVAIGLVSLVLLVGSLVWGLAPVRHVPSDRRVARFIEERTPTLDDRLVSAVDVIGPHPTTAPSALAGPMLADAATRAREVDLDDVLPRRALGRAGFQAAAAVFVLLIGGFFAAGPARQFVDAASLILFPSRAQLSVQPGDARVGVGMPVTIEARLVGSRAPINAQIHIEQGDQSKTVDMVGDLSGTFRLALDSVTSSFKYRAVAGKLTSPTYSISVERPPRVTRIDLEYTFPAALGLKPRSESDGGDIYAPAGTDVRVRIHTDRPAVSGQMTLGGGNTRPLMNDEPTALSTTFKIAADDSYRIGLVDREGLVGQDDTEYFIRVLEDRPPDVHITRPAADRSVSRLEEVDIEVQADDDYGVGRLELVYAVRGASEKAIALDIPRHATSVTARQTLYLEDLDVQPGDFVSYYARARDVTRSTRANEARSDIFFLEVKPYEQEFSLAMSQSMAGSGYSGALDELVDRQRQVVVATCKLNRRAENAKGARSAVDIRAVAQTEADLKAHVEQAASTFRESTMRDPRRRGPVAGPGQTRPEEDAMTAAADAMGRAVTSLDTLNTNDALPPEMQALNHLLKAQAEIKHRQLSANQSAAGAAGDNNRNYDLSTLFDRELQRQQQTNYETPQLAQRQAPAGSDELDRIKDLAKRQDELLRRQQALAGAQLPAEERKRELERLTREQSELRQRAEELARQNGNDGRSQGQMRDVSEAMRQAAGDLRRGSPEQAGTNASRALDTLRDLQRRMQSSRPDDRRRAAGEMQLEAKQLADGQRQIAAELGKIPSGDAGKDALRRLAGDQERLAERMGRLQNDLKEQAGVPQRGRQGDPNDNALREAARDLAGLSDRMQKSADDMRSAAPTSRSQAGAQQEIARQLDRLADRLSAATGSKEDDSRKLSEQLARTQELREKLDQVGRALESAGRQNGRGSSAQKTPGENGRLGEGRQGAGGVDMSKLREESLRQLQEAQNLLEEMRRQDPSLSRNGAGFTFEGQGMVLSAPGTEGFKQDFAKWDLLKRQATLALEQAESALAKKLQARASKDRLAAGIEDKAPSEYQKQVDAYFKALANKKP
jgi:hypothetical protein